MRRKARSGYSVRQPGTREPTPYFSLSLILDTVCFGARQRPVDRTEQQIASTALEKVFLKRSFGLRHQFHQRSVLN
jgi:hypothetical protein